MMFIAAMAFSACDDDDKNDNIKVPDAVSKALRTNILLPWTLNGNGKAIIS